MKTFRGTVVFRYYQEVTVQAESQDEAEQAMYGKVDLSKVDGESEVYDIEEVPNDFVHDPSKEVVGFVPPKSLEHWERLIEGVPLDTEEIMRNFKATRNLT